MKRYAAYLLLTALFYGCTGSSTKLLLQKSPYDSDFRNYADRLEGKKRKTKIIKKMETAYQSAQIADLLAVDSMLNLERPDRWLYVNAYHRRIQERQQKVLALLPLESPDGYKPDLLIINNIGERESASRQASARYLYQVSQDLLSTGRRADARAAFSTLVNLKDNYYGYWENMIGLIDSAAHVGTEHVLVEGVCAFYPGRANSRWQQFYTDPNARESFDIHIRSYGLSVYVSPDWENTSSHTETKEIQTGVEEKKDSTGQVVERTPIYETVTATVTITEVRKTADASVLVDVVDARTGALICTRPLTAQHQFSDKSVRISGDRRALANCPSESTFSIFTPTYWDMENKVLDLLNDDFGWFIKSRLWTEE